MKRLSTRALVPAALALMLLAMLGVAQAQDLCADIDYLTDQSRSKFAKVTDGPIGPSGDYGAKLALAGAAYCLVTKQSERIWYHCGWDYPYRAKRAYEDFNTLVGKINACIGQRATLHSDQSVNHPDYYDLRRYELDRAEVTVSVKDKSTLGSTLVFVRVQGRQEK